MRFIFIFIAFVSLHLVAGSGQASVGACVTGELFDLIEPRIRSDQELAVGIEIEAHSLWTNEEIAEDLFRQIKEIDQNAQLKKSQDGGGVFKIEYKDLGEEKTLKIMDDPSLYAKDSHKSIEIVSPKLNTKEQRDHFLGLIEHLRSRSKIEAAPEEGGLHIHVDFPDPSAVEILATLRIFRALQEDLAALLNVSDLRLGTYVPRIPKSLIELAESRATKNMGGKELLSFLDQRRKDRTKQVLNFFTENKTQTVEFRIFNSTVDPASIDMMADFSSGLIKGIRSGDPRLKNYLSRTESVTALALSEALDLKLSKKPDLIKKIAKELEDILAREDVWPPSWDTDVDDIHTDFYSLILFSIYFQNRFSDISSEER